MFKFLFSIYLTTIGQAIAACDQSSPADSDFPSSVVEGSVVEGSVVAGENQGIARAWYDGATDRYRHGVLGDAIEPSVIAIQNQDNCTISLELDTEHVFEDIAPRLANLDGVPGNEIITIRSHQNYGAQVAVYQLTDNTLKLLASTPYIGTSNRWLAPIGIADLNNDGDMDIAFVDRPHLAKVLRVWSFRDNELVEVANKSGYSNHRIGEDFISGGLKLCDDTAAMITADANWRRIIETRLVDEQLVSTDIGAFEGTESLTRATICQ